MIERKNSRNALNKYAPTVHRRVNNHRPFWLPASNFYVLSVAFAIAVFFISWAIQHEDNEEMPLVSSGLLASMVLAGAVVLREVILRSARYRLLLAQGRIDYNIKRVYGQSRKLPLNPKLSINENAQLLGQIEKQSKAATEIGKSAEQHWQVFELCDEYLERNERELEFVRNDSPRLPVLQISRAKVQNLHKFHLLAWSSLESRALIQEANISAAVSQKLENANRALTILDSAEEFYPAEKELIESKTAVKEFIATIKVSHWIEQAERAAFKGNYKRAIDHYRDALFYLVRENVTSDERDLIAAKINSAIEQNRKLLKDDRN